MCVCVCVCVWFFLKVRAYLCAFVCVRVSVYKGGDSVCVYVCVRACVCI